MEITNAMWNEIKEYILAQVTATQEQRKNVHTLSEESYFEGMLDAQIDLYKRIFDLEKEVNENKKRKGS